MSPHDTPPARPSAPRRSSVGRRRGVALGLVVSAMAWAVASAPPASDDHDLTTAARWTTSVTSDLPDARTDRFQMTATATTEAPPPTLRGMDVPAARLASATDQSAGFVWLTRFRTFATWRVDMTNDGSAPIDVQQRALLDSLSLVFRLRLPGSRCRDTPASTEKAYWTSALNSQHTTVDLTRPDPFSGTDIRLDTGASRLFCVEPLIKDATKRDLSVSDNYADWVRTYGGRGVEVRMTTALTSPSPATWTTPPQETSHTVHVDLPPAQGPRGSDVCAQNSVGNPVLYWAWPRDIDGSERTTLAVHRWELVEQVGTAWVSVAEADMVYGRRRDYELRKAAFMPAPGKTRTFAMRLHPFSATYAPGSGVYVDSEWKAEITNNNGVIACGGVTMNPDAGPHGWPK